MNAHCFYHRADLDGHCCGAIARKWCGLNGHAYIPRGVDYGDPADWFRGAAPDAMAVIMDFTPEDPAARDILMDMNGAYGGGLVWIDHHKTALDKASPADGTIFGLRESGTAACVLAWRFFFGGGEPAWRYFFGQEGGRNPVYAVPPAVTWLGMYDVWDRADPGVWENVVLPFQYGMRLRETEPDGTDEPGLWEKLLDSSFGFGCDPMRIREDGVPCLRHERKNARRAALSRGYDCAFEGLPCCALNADGNGSALDAYARPEHKLRVLWRFDGKLWRVSLYGNGHADTDCGKIAARFGGGGHKDAAGFALEEGRDAGRLFAPPDGKAEREGKG